MFPYIEPLPVKLVRLLRNRLVATGVVIGGTVTLTAATLPLFATRCSGCRPPSCQSHIKQASLGLVMYMQDYDERLPAADEWSEAVWPYVKNRDVFQCPMAVQEDKAAYGIAFNSPLATRRASDFTVPEEKLPLLYDSFLLYKDAAAPVQFGIAFPGRHDRTGHDILRTGQNTFWAARGSNIGFLDGRVRWTSDYDTDR